MKTCNRCKQHKELSEFGKDKHSKDGNNPKCRQCCNDFQRGRKIEKRLYDQIYRQLNADRLSEKSRQRDPEKRRLWKLKHKFNLTAEDEKRMIVAQKNLCATCLKPEWVVVRGQVKRLAVDHSRKTGVVRALLCNNCNRALGMIYEDVDTLSRMVAYLKKHNPVTSND